MVGHIGLIRNDFYKFYSFTISILYLIFYYLDKYTLANMFLKTSSISLVESVGVNIIMIIIIIIIILLKQDYKIQLANNKIQMAWLTSWLVVG